jgi:hypothetical protein
MGTPRAVREEGRRLGAYGKKGMIFPNAPHQLRPAPRLRLI